jgi:EAL domain-containing protein (putative c-di-GMP-specific phosphodiesterase class I)
MYNRAFERMSVESSLRHALRRNEFTLEYQPQVNLSTGAVIGNEALIRWKHPERGRVLPLEFIPVAEDSGLIGEISEWVLLEACRQNRAWHDAGLPAVPVAVNISPAQFHRRGFLDSVTKILDDASLDPCYLELELTESTIMRDVDLAISTLKALKHMGVHISIDDFGTGYSSLSYLKRLPIDTLKIDESFVRDITTDPDDAAIIGAIISMAKSLKHRVIAEGVESSAQLGYLRAKRCYGVQGNYFSRPLAPHLYPAFVSGNAALIAPNQGRLRFP